MPPKGARTPMVWKENRENAYCEITPAILALKEQWEKKNYIDPKLYKEYNVKRGLRDEDGRGVLTGLTRVGEIQSYSVTEGEQGAHRSSHTSNPSTRSGTSRQGNTNRLPKGTVWPHSVTVPLWSGAEVNCRFS